MCKCGCNTCDIKAVTLVKHRYTPILSEALTYIINNKKSLRENPFSPGSEAYFSLWREARYLYSRGIINVCSEDAMKIRNTRLGEQALYKGKVVPLDYLLSNTTLKEGVQHKQLYYFTTRKNKVVKVDYSRGRKKTL